MNKRLQLCLFEFWEIFARSKLLYTYVYSINAYLKYSLSIQTTRRWVLRVWVEWPIDSPTIDCLIFRRWHHRMHFRTRKWSYDKVGYVIHFMYIESHCQWLLWQNKSANKSSRELEQHHLIEIPHAILLHSVRSREFFWGD